jgi:hypothetical protein
MPELPHDVSDLYLAPTALAVDARIAELGTLDDARLRAEVARESDEPDRSVEMRIDALLRAVGYLLDLHGWVLSWDDRGIRLSHDKRSLVLGAPANFGRYVAGTSSR